MVKKGEKLTEEHKHKIGEGVHRQSQRGSEIRLSDAQKIANLGSTSVACASRPPKYSRPVKTCNIASARSWRCGSDREQ